MRIWSLHPRYLDPAGLVALWRETLLAKAVLRGATKGYRQHPQLERFKAHANPVGAIDAYLAGVHREATGRGYRFDAAKIGPVPELEPIPVTGGQLGLEWRHLLAKLSVRSPALFERWSGVERPDCHPLFRPEPGPVAPWERAGDIAPGSARPAK